MVLYHLLFQYNIKMLPTHVDPIAVEPLMMFDDLAWERSDNISGEWKHKVFDEKVLREIGRAIIKHRGGPPEELFNPQKGPFN